jgi:hypothetical protein
MLGCLSDTVSEQAYLARQNFKQPEPVNISQATKEQASSRQLEGASLGCKKLAEVQHTEMGW